jgi:C1A family cysteine protease
MAQIDPSYFEKVERWRRGVKNNPGPIIEKRKAHSFVGKDLKREAELPESFNWATETDADGNSLILPTRDQLTCGSCYAFCATQVLSERLSIASNGENRVILSTQDMISSGPQFTSEVLNNQSVLQPYIDAGTAAEAEW